MSKDFKIEPDGTVRAVVLPTEDFVDYIRDHHINTNDETHIVGWEIEGENGLKNMPCDLCEEEEK